MSRAIAALLLAFLVSLPLQAKNKNDSIEDVILDVIRDEIGDDEKGKGKGKGNGRPDNPGQHGRDNARKKQCQNPGKGSKCDSDWVDTFRDEIDDDEKNKGKGKGKNK